MLLQEGNTVEHLFNTSAIFTNEFSGILFSNLIYTIIGYLKEEESNIIYLAQFRRFENQLDPDNPQGTPDNPDGKISMDKEMVICAAFIYSSIIKGFDMVKLSRKKVNFNERPYKLVKDSLIKFIVQIESYIV